MIKSIRTIRDVFNKSNKNQLDFKRLDYDRTPYMQNGGFAPSIDQIAQLLSGRQNLQESVIGGIFYNPIQKQEDLDIYGDPIDLSNLYALGHAPVSMNDWDMGSGYVPKYNFKNNTDEEQLVDAESDSSDSIQEQEQESEIIQSNPVLVTVQTINQSTVGYTPEPVRETKILFGKSDFKKLEKLYAKELNKRGIDKAYAKWLAAQDALESGWGISQGARRHNYGNITTGAWNGGSFVGDDHDEKGNPIKQTFRAYSSVNEYVKDKLDFLQTIKRYKNVFVGDPSKVIDRMYEAGYAVDPDYVKKVKSVYNKWDS